MCLLGVLDLAGVLPRRRVDVLRPVQLPGLRARGVDGRLRQRRGVGTHVGDVAVLVQPLRDAHGALGGEPQLAAGFLLQRRRHERGVGLARVRLLLHRADGQRLAAQPGGQGARSGLVEDQHLVGLLDGAERVEITAGGHASAVDGVELGGELRRGRFGIGDAGVQLSGDVPVAGAAERHAFALALHDDPGGDGLHAARRQLRRDLFPQHRADFVAVEPVENAPGLLRIDQGDVQVTRILRGGQDRGLGDLVEHHAPDRHLGLERLEEVPRDGLTLAVTVRREVELVDTLEQVLEFGDGALLVGADDVERLEVVVDVHAEARPGLTFIFGRHVRGVAREVANVSARRFDDIVGAEVTGNLARLGRRLDYDESPDPAAATGTIEVSHRIYTLHFLVGTRTPNECLTVIRFQGKSQFDTPREPTQTGCGQNIRAAPAKSGAIGETPP